MKYHVHFEETVWADVAVEADSYEQAVAEALKQRPAPTAKRMTPDWVGTEEHMKKYDEYEHEVVGPCERCGTQMVSREIPGQPWVYGSDPDNEHGGLVCFKCLGAKKAG
jgi:hypothetical protein